MELQSYGGLTEYFDLPTIDSNSARDQEEGRQVMDRLIGDYVYINGSFFHKDEAKVSVFDHGFTYGDGIFEGLGVVNGGIFKLEAHMDRLYRSARFMGIDIRISREAFIKAIIETARRNNLREGYMRPIVTRGAGPMGIRHMDKLGEPTIVIVAQYESVETSKKVFENGIAAHVVSLRRIPPECLDSRVKSCNYINNILAYLEAKQAGADTAIMLDIHGFVAEGYANNLFAVRKGVVYTPLLGNILEGIGRETIIGLCPSLDLEVHERAMTVYDFVTADEVFESSTMSKGVVPISSIDGRRVGDGKVGPIFKRIHGEFHKLMASCKESTMIFEK